MNPTERPNIPLHAEHWLQEEFLRRRGRNPRYSLRAFSRHVGLSSGRLSELLSGKRQLGPRLAERLAEKLFRTPDERKTWIDSVVMARQARLRARRLTAVGREAIADEEYQRLTDNELRVIRDWYHLAILNLIKLEDFQDDPEWIARRLGITKTQARSAFQRLEKLGLIGRENGRWARTARKLTTTTDVPSEVLRSAHAQLLGLARQSLKTVPIDERDITSVCFTISPEKLPEAKKLLRNFRRHFAELVEGGEATEVYQLCLALFPLTRKTEAPQ